VQKIITKTFTPPHPLKTAVLFMVFNRPDTTKQVFEAIRLAKPPRLYIAADGPRADKHGEAEKVRHRLTGIARSKPFSEIKIWDAGWV